MRHTKTAITLSTLLLFALVPRAHAEPTEIRLVPDPSLCTETPSDVLDGLGLSKTSLFIEEARVAGELCLASALELAIIALATATGDEHPLEIARDVRRPRCDVRCWFDRTTAAVAGPTLANSIWPMPDGIEGTTGGPWFFFATSPDLSPHWHWVAVGDRTSADGSVLVRIWSER